MYNKIIGKCVICNKDLKGDFVNSLFSMIPEKLIPILCDECAASKLEASKSFVHGLIYRIRLDSLHPKTQSLFGKVHPNYVYGQCIFTDSKKWLKIYPVTWFRYVTIEPGRTICRDISRAINSQTDSTSGVSINIDKIPQIEGVILESSKILLSKYPYTSNNKIRSILLTLTVNEYEHRFFSRLHTQEFLGKDILNFIEDVSSSYISAENITKNTFGAFFKEKHKEKKIIKEIKEALTTKQEVPESIKFNWGGMPKYKPQEVLPKNIPISEAIEMHEAFQKNIYTNQPMYGYVGSSGDTTATLTTTGNTSSLINSADSQ